MSFLFDIINYNKAFPVETDYSISDNTLCSFMILSISFIKSRLDISPYSATPEDQAERSEA